MPSKSKDILTTIVWMALSIASYLVVVASIRSLSHTMDPSQTALVRNVIGLAACLVIASRTPGVASVLRRVSLSQHLGRAIIHAAGGLMLIWSVGNLPLALVSTMEFTGPVFGMAIAALVLRERIGATAINACLFVVFGICTIAFLTQQPIGPSLLVPIAATGLLTFATLQMRSMAKEQPIVLIMLMMNAFQIPIYLATGQMTGWRDLTGVNWLDIAPAICGLGFAGLATQACLAKASRTTSATMMTVIDTMRIPAVMTLGYAGYGESIDAALVIGATMVAFGAITISIQGAKSPSTTEQVAATT